MNTTTTTETTPLPPRDELHALALKIETYRADAGMPKTLFCRQNDALGSVRTYDKILSGEDDLNAEKWLESYRAVWSRLRNADLEDPAAGGSGVTLLKELTAPAELCRAYIECRARRTADRFILLVGPNGAGKTSAVDILAAQPYGENVRRLEASAAWMGANDHGTAVPLLHEIGRALGMEGLPGRKAKLLHAVRAKLSERRWCLAIEEGQHLCTHGLDTLKGLLNTTPSTIILTGQRKLLTKLSASETGRQLIGNRLATLVIVGGGAGMSADDVRALMQAAGVTLEERRLDETARALITEGKTRGCLKFVARVLTAYRAETDESDGKPKMKPGADTLLALINREKRARDGAE
ncbi:MAG: ATP-binding protein [Verrucomicrobiaceae bacterium]|nr:ATP-binding protein [Verrucomicrobiaceae bacterium]